MTFIYEEPKGTRGVRSLKEGEDSPTVRLLEYIAQYGSTKGAGVALGGGGERLAMPLRRLTVGGYISPVEGGRYELTEKGLEYLGSTGPFYERAIVDKTLDLEERLIEELLSLDREAEQLIEKEDWDAWHSKQREISKVGAQISELRRGWRFDRLG